MSGDKNFGASLWRRHTTTALSAQARDGARGSFGEALHARHMQFSQLLMRRVGERGQRAGVQRTFAVARRTDSASGCGGDDASASAVADGAGELATSAASDVAVPLLHQGSAAARQDSRSAKGERAVSKHPVDAGASGHAGPTSARAMSGSLVPRVPVSSSGSMPSAGMVMCSAPETHSIKRTSRTPLAGALALALAPALVARIGSPIVLHAAHDLSERPCAPEHTRVEIAPDTQVRHDAGSVAADSFIDGQMQCGPSMPGGATDRLPDAQVVRQVAMKVTHERPVASLIPDAASYAILPETGGELPRASAGGAPVEGAARSARRLGASIEHAAPPFAAHPLARAVLSASGSRQLNAAGPLSPVPMVSKQSLSSLSAPSASVDRVDRAHQVVAATNHIADRTASKTLTTDARAPSSHVQKPTTMHAPPSAAEPPMPEHGAWAMRRAVVAATSMPDMSSASNAKSTVGASSVAHVSRAEEASRTTAASNTPGVSGTSNASSGTSARSRASEATLSRMSIASAARTAALPPPLARAFARSDRIEAPQGEAIARPEPKAFPVRDAVVLHRSQSIESPAAASNIMKETPLSSASRVAADVSRQPYSSTPARDTTWRPSSAIDRFVDIDRESRPRPCQGTAMPTGAVDGQTQRPPTHWTVREASAIDGQMQLPLMHATATDANAASRETHPPPALATATDASAIDHERQPPRYTPSLPGIASRAIHTEPVAGASPRKPATNVVQRTPATSVTVKPQAAVRQTARLPLRVAREPRDPRETCCDGVPIAAWTERGSAPASSASEPALIDRAAEQYGVISPVTHVTRDVGAPATASTPPTVSAGAGADTRATAAAGSAANTGADASELAEQAWQLILDKLAIEQERRGYTSWA